MERDLLLFCRPKIHLGRYHICGHSTEYQTGLYSIKEMARTPIGDTILIFRFYITVILLALFGCHQPPTPALAPSQSPPPEDGAVILRSIVRSLMQKPNVRIGFSRVDSDRRSNGEIVIGENGKVRGLFSPDKGQPVLLVCDGAESLTQGFSGTPPEKLIRKKARENLQVEFLSLFVHAGAVSALSIEPIRAYYGDNGKSELEMDVRNMTFEPTFIEGNKGVLRYKWFGPYEFPVEMVLLYDPSLRIPIERTTVVRSTQGAKVSKETYSVSWPESLDQSQFSIQVPPK